MKKVLQASAFFMFLLITSLAAHAQDFTATGIVKDFTTQEPIVGATVVVKGKNAIGTTTDKDGKFSLKLTSPSTLVISFIGYEFEEIEVSPENADIEVGLLENIQELMKIEIVGSRSLNRTITETPVAIDVISITDVAKSVGQMDINQLLQYVAPSFNSNRQSGSDGSDHIDPATLRGLGPDQTLVLINGKRRHQSALINLYGTRGRGNTGTDLNAIPVSAIERIEILRDGAAAQYGSDAIAGVINIVLKSSADELKINVNNGIYSKGDGLSTQINSNYGFKVGGRGFVNFTTDILSRGRTNRPADPNEFDIYRKYVGDAKASNFSTFFNSVVPINSTTEFYAFGGYNARNSDAYAWTRDFDSDRNVQSIYPNGFTPHIKTNVEDKSFSAGVRGELKGWNVDFNNTFGGNKLHYFVDSSLNASLLDKSPTRFDAGGFSLAQNTTGVNFTKYFASILQGSNVAFGLEHRIDNYQIFAGEEASWRNYGVIDTVINGVVTKYDALGRPGGSQGFPGFQPSNVVNEYRSNIGAYADAEFDLTKDFMVAVAGRFERYSDFGNTFNTKIATRYSFSPSFALRGSASTGFRAPSLAQVYFNSVFTDFVSGQPVDKFIAKNNSNITRVLGIPALKQETATNASLGMTLDPSDEFTFSVDGYYVDIKNRIVLTGAFEDSDPEIGADLQKLGVGAAQFFTNAVDTRTMGLDIIGSYTKNIGYDSRFRATVAANFNKMELTAIHTSDKLKGKEELYFGKREQFFLLASAPPSKINLTLDYRIKKVNFNLRMVRFGKIELIDWVDEVDVYDPRYSVDFTTAFNITSNINLTIGGANILNAYPTKQDTETETGGNYDAVQMGFNGAFLFSRLALKF